MTCYNQNPYGPQSLISGRLNRHNNGFYENLCKLIQGDNTFIQQYVNDANWLHIKSVYGQNYLSVACRLGDTASVKMLINANVDLNAPDNSGLTPLHYAVLSNQPEMMDLMLRQGANIHALCNKGSSPLHLAISKNYKNLVELTLNALQNKVCIEEEAEEEDVEEDSEEEGEWKKGEQFNELNTKTCLNIACLGGNIDMVKLLLKFFAVDKNCNTPLLQACCVGHTDLVKLLLTFSSDINAVSASGCTALHIACDKGFTDIVQLLIYHGCDINVKDASGETPLHCAVLGQHYDIVKLLLSQDHVEIDNCNHYQQTSFLQAIVEGHVGIIHMFVLKGTDIDAVDEDGDNCLHAALKTERFHSETENIEILKKICYDLKEERLSSIVIAGYLAEQGANFYHKNKTNTTPFDLVIDSALKKRLKIFLSKVYECMSCGDNRATVKFHPCRHRVACQVCCSKIDFKKCHRCKQHVTSKTAFDGSKVDVENSSLELKNQNIEEQFKCSICMDRQWNMVFECGHTTCKKCGELLLNCHLCRKPINKKIIVH